MKVKRIRCLSCQEKFRGQGRAAHYQICYPCYVESDHANAVAFRQEIPVSKAKGDWTLDGKPVSGDVVLELLKRFGES
jgi:hypothetical protein